MDTIDLNEIGIKDKLRGEVERFKKFHYMFLGTKETVNINEIDIRNYAKYLLIEGGDTEKRELMSCFRSKILLANKVVTLE